MDRNELKVKVLRLLCSQARTSHDTQAALEKSEGVTLNHRAVEMALLRYWRQGLLKRERKGRRFNYSLTDRGKARLEWLSIHNEPQIPR